VDKLQFLIFISAVLLPITFSFYIFRIFRRQFFIFKMVASVILDFENRKILLTDKVRRADMNHCAKISQPVAEIL